MKQSCKLEVVSVDRLCWLMGQKAIARLTSLEGCGSGKHPSKRLHAVRGKIEQQGMPSLATEGSHVALLICGLTNLLVMQHTEGVYTAREFVWWYNGHPEYCTLPIDLSKVEFAISSSLHSSVPWHLTVDCWILPALNGSRKPC